MDERSSKTAGNPADNGLGTEALGCLLLRLAVPSILAQMVNLLYNLVDRVFVGRIPDTGSLALAGIGVAFPVIMFISAFAGLAGMGGAPRASMAMGRGDNEEAERILGSALVFLILTGGLLSLLFLAVRRPLLHALGASPNTIEFADEYLTVYLFGTVAVQLTLGLNQYISCQGFAREAMTTVCIGAVLNILLDPLFIFTFRMGVRGAALATILSQGVSACWVVGFLCSGRSGLRIRRKNMGLDPKVIGSIAALGIAPFIMQSTESLVTVVLNSGLQHYGGDLYVGTITVMQSVMQMVVMPIQGISQGVQPIMSFNFGAKNYARVWETFRLLLRTMLCITVCSFLLVFFFPKQIALIFNNNQELVELVGRVMPIFFGGIWAFGAQMSCQSAFMAMGQAKTSLFLALLRKIILLIPLAILLPRIMGNVMGIYIAEPIADILASATTLTLFLRRKKSLLPTEKI